MKTVPLLDLLCSRDRRVSRKEHYARILCGEVLVDGQCVKDAKKPVLPQVGVEYRPRRRYVSRGGDKLAGVIVRWDLDVRGLGFIDAGASSGGFTDCLLQHGASRVIAVETGKNQLDYRLRSDPRVTSFENTNIMSLPALPYVPEAAVADLSLRSLRKAAVHLLGLVSLGWLVALIKPQYEWTLPPVDFDGVVTQVKALFSILETLFQDLRAEGAFVRRLAPSPLPGRKGNREFFCLLGSHEDRAGGNVKRMIVQAVGERP
jgi:23S rRNA (cytidine1920-2'-O)/16S rRNA (cytidine1409-2'-O)-methyltransferase